MPHQNRVTPFGDIIATPERGTMYGNRGCLVDGRGLIMRQFKEIRWLICVLDFKERRHPMMAPGRYTGLFFLDEATALAAGHRPCAECQRGRFNLFREDWAKANPKITSEFRPKATAIDAFLHQERLGPRAVCTSLDGLPNGIFLTDNDVDAHLLLEGKLLRWTSGGYKITNPDRLNFPAKILTPASVVNALSAGYPVDIHPSAFDVS